MPVLSVLSDGAVAGNIDSAPSADKLDREVSKDSIPVVVPITNHATYSWVWEGQTVCSAVFLMIIVTPLPAVPITTCGLERMKIDTMQMPVGESMTYLITIIKK